ncbi:MAG: hypothetical protein CM15mP98_11670 [Paracoccaceae bacterium]|nr:MAG: hypothetical protein CM15mP98_11670 [Paracoccaceae bacterium]
MGNGVVSWQNEVNKELVPSEFQDYLSEMVNQRNFVEFLLNFRNGCPKKDFTGRISRNYVLNNFKQKIWKSY